MQKIYTCKTFKYSIITLLKLTLTFPIEQPLNKEPKFGRLSISINCEVRVVVALDIELVLRCTAKCRSD